MVANEDMDYESKNEVERIVNEISEVTVTVENYKKYISKIQNTERVVMAQLENFTRVYKEHINKLNEKLKSESFKQADAQGFVPKDVFELQTNINNVLRDSYSWKSLATQMNKIFFTKISTVLDEINALDIKKGTLQEMREMETRRNENQLQQINRIAEMVEEIVNHKLKMMDDKIINTVRFIEQEARNEKQGMMNTFIEAIKINQRERNKLLELLKHGDTTLREGANEIKKTIETPIHSSIDHTYKDVEEDSDEENNDDNPFNDDDDDEIIVDDEEDDELK